VDKGLKWIAVVQLRSGDGSLSHSLIKSGGGYLSYFGPVSCDAPEILQILVNKLFDTIWISAGV
jgi:hypothetical protein